MEGIGDDKGIIDSKSGSTRFFSDSRMGGAPGGRTSLLAGLRGEPPKMSIPSSELLGRISSLC